MVVQLRDYQVDVIGRSRGRIVQGARRVLIQAPTGAGKTHIACEIIRCAVAKGSRVLFLVHRRRLVRQISERLELFGVYHGVIMAGESTTSYAPVQVASRDTLLSRAVRNEWVGFPPAELVVLDEAHNLKVTGSDDDLAGYESILKVYPHAVILGLTATPARSDGRGLGRFFQALECTVPVSQLIREGWLVPVQCYAPERMGTARRSGKKVKGLAGDPVGWWKKLAEGRPTIVFTSKVDQSEAVVEAFKGAGIAAAHIDAHTPDEERERVIDAVKRGRVQVVSNVGVFTEGVDVPELSCCVLLRMAESYVLFAQAVGRVMRSHPGKENAILIDHSGATYKHGLPDLDVEWKLDEGETVDERRKAQLASPDKRPLVCPRCAAVFAGSIRCPSCNHVLAKKLRPVETRDELLTQVQRDLDPVKAEEEKVRYWFTALRVMAHKGRSLSAARCMWKAKFKEWPPATLPHNDFSFQDWQRPVAELLPNFAPRRVTA